MADSTEYLSSDYDATEYIHDLIKINFVTEGYLPNYPYHLLSDAEMCDAFLRYSIENNTVKWDGYFCDVYKLPDQDELSNTNYATIEKAYKNLGITILYYLHELKNSKEPSYTLPDWIYSYMLGKVVGKDSEALDVHDIIYPLGADNIDDDFTDKAAYACYNESKKWLNKTRVNANITGVDDRYVTVSKSDYGSSCSCGCNCNSDDENEFLSLVYGNGETIPIDEITNEIDMSKVPDSVKLNLRPSTIFGEPHVIKSIRLNDTYPTS